MSRSKISRSAVVSHRQPRRPVFLRGSRISDGLVVPFGRPLAGSGKVLEPLQPLDALLIDGGCLTPGPQVQRADCGLVPVRMVPCAGPSNHGAMAQFNSPSHGKPGACCVVECKKEGRASFAACRLILDPPTQKRPSPAPTRPVLSLRKHHSIHSASTRYSYYNYLALQLRIHRHYAAVPLCTPTFRARATTLD